VVLVLSLLSNAVAGALRGWGLQDPEQHMQAAELADRSNVHVWRIVRWVSLMTGAAVDRYKLAAI
jgi:hypothetical protein